MARYRLRSNEKLFIRWRHINLLLGGFVDGGGIVQNDNVCSTTHVNEWYGRTKAEIQTARAYYDKLLREAEALLTETVNFIKENHEDDNS